jgi:hypothetical protein
MTCAAILTIDGRPSVGCTYSGGHLGAHSFDWLCSLAPTLTGLPGGSVGAAAMVGLDDSGRCKHCFHAVREHVVALDATGRAAAACLHPDGNVYFCHDGSRVTR